MLEAEGQSSDDLLGNAASLRVSPLQACVRQLHSQSRNISGSVHEEQNDWHELG